MKYKREERREKSKSPCVFHKVVAAKDKYRVFVSPYAALIPASLTLSSEEHLTINMSVR